MTKAAEEYSPPLVRNPEDSSRAPRDAVVAKNVRGDKTVTKEAITAEFQGYSSLMEALCQHARTCDEPMLFLKWRIF